MILEAAYNMPTDWLSGRSGEYYVIIVLKSLIKYSLNFVLLLSDGEELLRENIDFLASKGGLHLIKWNERPNRCLGYLNNFETIKAFIE